MAHKIAFMLPGGPMKFLRPLREEDPLFRSLREKIKKEKGILQPEIRRDEGTLLTLFRKTYKKSPHMPMFKGGWRFKGEQHNEYLWEHQSRLGAVEGDPTYLWLDLSKFDQGVARIHVEIQDNESKQIHLVQRLTLDENSAEELEESLTEYFWKRFQIKLNKIPEIREIEIQEKEGLYDLPEDQRILILRQVYREAQKHRNKPAMRFIESVANQIKTKRPIALRDKDRVSRLMNEYGMDPNLELKWHVSKKSSTQSKGMKNLLKIAAQTVQKNPELATKIAPLVRIAMEQDKTVQRFKDLALTRMSEALKRGGIPKLLIDTRTRIRRIQNPQKLFGLLLAIEDFRKVLRDIRRPAVQKLRMLERMGTPISNMSDNSPSTPDSRL